MKKENSKYKETMRDAELKLKEMGISKLGTLVMSNGSIYILNEQSLNIDVGKLLEYFKEELSFKEELEWLVLYQGLTKLNPDIKKATFRLKHNSDYQKNNFSVSVSPVHIFAYHPCDLLLIEKYLVPMGFEEESKKLRLTGMFDKGNLIDEMDIISGMIGKRLLRILKSVEKEIGTIVSSLIKHTENQLKKIDRGE